jgi:hypothetical protein
MRSGDKPTHFCSVSDNADCYHAKWWQADHFCSVSDKADCYVKWWQAASFLLSIGWGRQLSCEVVTSWLISAQFRMRQTVIMQSGDKLTISAQCRIRQTVMRSGDKPTHFCSVSDKADCYHAKWWQADHFCSVSDKADCYVKWWQAASFLLSIGWGRLLSREVMTSWLISAQYQIRQTVIMQSDDKQTHFCSVSDEADCYHVKWWQAASFPLSIGWGRLLSCEVMKSWLISAQYQFDCCHDFFLPKFTHKNLPIFMPKFLECWIIGLYCISVYGEFYCTSLCSHWTQ